jgi:hypothetical protein
MFSDKAVNNLMRIYETYMPTELFLHYVQKRKLLHLPLFQDTTQYANDSLICIKIIHNIRKSISSSNGFGIKYILKKCKLISCQPNTL